MSIFVVLMGVRSNLICINYIFSVLYFKLRRKPIVKNEIENGIDNNGMVDVDLGINGREVYRSNESTYM